MLRISKLTDYATVILAALAEQPDAAAARPRRWPSAPASQPPTVSKLLKQLHRAGLVSLDPRPARRLPAGAARRADHRRRTSWMPWRARWR